jgi:hypothetical protein
MYTIYQTVLTNTYCTYVNDNKNVKSFKEHNIPVNRNEIQVILL